jgi:hypothetical protein
MDLNLAIFFLGLGFDHFDSGVTLCGEQIFLTTDVIEGLSALGTKEACGGLAKEEGGLGVGFLLIIIITLLFGVISQSQGQQVLPHPQAHPS